MQSSSVCISYAMTLQIIVLNSKNAFATEQQVESKHCTLLVSASNDKYGQHNILYCHIQGDIS